MAAQGARHLDGEPRIGQRLAIDGQQWSVAHHSSSWSGADSDHVDQWELSGARGVAYLLREADGGHLRWFFTRNIPTSALTVAAGEQRLDRWLSTGAPRTPPSSLTYRGVAYTYEDTTEDTTEDTQQEEPGRTTPRTTWDYWDGAHTWNVSVERWPDGRDECCHGRYVDEAEIGVTAVNAPLGAGPVLLVLASGAFFLTLVVGVAVDVALTVGLASCAGLAFLLSLRSRALALPWLVGTLVLATAFVRFPPLTSVAGLAALAAVAAAMTRWSGMRSSDDVKAHGLWMAWIAATAAVIPSAIYHYFWFAPGPHTFGQFVLALGPAPLAGLVAMLMAWLVLRLPDTHR